MMHARRTLLRFYLYAVLNGLQFTWTTWLAYVLARGGNPGWAEAAFHLAILIGEVPTGAVADLLGRRTSMLVGQVLKTLAVFGFLFVHDTPTAVLVMALSGLAETFSSGADTALLYEAAEEAGGPELARRALARSGALQMGSLAIAPALAGLLYQWHDWAPFVARGVVAVAAFLVIRGMTEVRPAKPPAGAVAGLAAPPPGPLADPPGHPLAFAAGLWRQMRAGVASGLGDPAVRPLLLFGWILYTILALAGQFGQAYFPAAGLTMAATGLVFTGAGVAGTAGNLLAGRLPDRWAGTWLRLAPAGVALAYLAMGLGSGWAGPVAFLLGDFLAGVLEPLFQHRLNRAILGSQRATILSVQSAGFSLLMAGAFPAAAYLEPVSRIYLVAGAVGLVLAVFWAVAGRPGC